jgi:hypothetical protein
MWRLCMAAFQEEKLLKFMDPLVLARPFLGERCEENLFNLAEQRYRVQLAASALYAGEGVIWVGQLSLILSLICS